MPRITRQHVLISALVASVALNVGMIGYLATTGGLRRVLLRLDLVAPPQFRAPFQLDDEARYRLLPNTPGEIIFAGDSLINDGPWSEFYSTIRKRGIGGDRTDGVLNRLDEILDGQPKLIVFLMGSNDLSAAVPVAQILRNYRAILTRVQTESPATRVIVIGVLPVNPRFPASPIYSNKQVEALNDPLEQLVHEFPAARFVSVADLLTNEQGELKPEFSTDGLHMTLQGYLALKSRVQELIDRP